MAYRAKTRNVETLLGTMRLAGRDMEDINAATQAPSATGGAPTLVETGGLRSITDQAPMRPLDPNLEKMPQIIPIVEGEPGSATLPTIRPGEPGSATLPTIQPWDPNAPTDRTIQPGGTATRVIGSDGQPGPIQREPIMQVLMEQRPMFQPQDYLRADPQMGRIARGLAQDIINRMNLVGIEDPEELGALMVARVYSFFEPIMRNPRPLADPIYRSSEARNIVSMMNRWEWNRIYRRGRTG
jgi:hypothetical protein